MNDYHFISRWDLAAPIEEVFGALRDYTQYPVWWRDVRQVRLSRNGDEQGIGMVVRYRIQSPLLYSLAFDIELVDFAEPTLISTRASGQLDGTGVWRLAEAEPGTSASYFWDVATTRPWMNIVAPIARPAFIAAHRSVMKRGAAGLAGYLGTRLINAS